MLKTFAVSTGLSCPSLRTVFPSLYARPTSLHGAKSVSRTRKYRMATRPTPQTATSAPNYTIPFITVAVLFGIFGFLTSLNNQLVAKLEETFKLAHGPAMLATAAWFLAYLVFSVPSGKLIELVG